ncbi:MAG TPA: hypothetical protein VN692_03985, partial [Steroidobacteraceae bacterium]|nr:hypothetical protein [Steroidobacteraceae bacterium]
QLADAKQGLASDPVRTFAPNDTVNLGDPAPGHPAWEVAEPFGTDMIIAIASSQPLFEKPRPANIEAAKDYLRALKDAVEAARRRNVTVVGNALLVDTVPK